jgi:hypothetical protein
MHDGKPGRPSSDACITLIICPPKDIVLPMISHKLFSMKHFNHLPEGVGWPYSTAVIRVCSCKRLFCNYLWQKIHRRHHVLVAFRRLSLHFPSVCLKNDTLLIDLYTYYIQPVMTDNISLIIGWHGDC